MANLFTRDDTLLGVCEGLGEEFGFHANYLRVALAAMLLVNPLAVIGLYLALGIVLAISRWLVPAHGPASEPAAAPAASNDDAAATSARAA